MAQRVEMQITCDRVAPGHGGEVESLDMTLGGTGYQIDLCAKHRKPYNDLLEMITMDGRRVSTRGRQQSAARKQPGRTNRNAEIRAWAKEQGIDVSARGRIADEVVQKYDARQLPEQQVPDIPASVDSDAQPLKTGPLSYIRNGRLGPPSRTRKPFRDYTPVGQRDIDLVREFVPDRSR